MQPLGAMSTTRHKKKVHHRKRIFKNKSKGKNELTCTDTLCFGSGGTAMGVKAFSFSELYSDVMLHLLGVA